VTAAAFKQPASSASAARALAAHSRWEPGLGLGSWRHLWVRRLPLFGAYKASSLPCFSSWQIHVASWCVYVCVCVNICLRSKSV